MSGVLLRRGSGPSHACRPPEAGVEGDVWRCGCGRRWTCVRANYAIDVPDDDVSVPVSAEWERRLWPWPRRQAPS